jgi:hypothetical protein
LGVTDGTTGTYNVGLGGPAKTGDYFFGTNNSTLYYCYSASNSLFAEVQGRQGNQGNQGRQGLQGLQGVQGNQGSQGDVGIIGTIEIDSSPFDNIELLRFKSGTNIFIDGDSKGNSLLDITINASISAGGNNKSVQFNDNNSLSGIDSVQIVSSVNAFNDSGLSANLVKYTESVTSFNYTSVLSGTGNELTIPFGSFNVFSVDDIKLNTNTTTLTVTGFSGISTGESMTLILGHTGVAGSRIIFPSSAGIWWSGGVIGGVGSTSTIFPSATKKYDIIHFFSDGSKIFANYVLDFSQ